MKDAFGITIAPGDHVVVAMRHSSSIWLQDYTVMETKGSAGVPVLMDSQQKTHTYRGRDQAIAVMGSSLV